MGQWGLPQTHSPTPYPLALALLKVLANAAIGSCAAHRAPAAEGEAAQSPTQNLAFGKKLAELMLKVLAKRGAFGAAADAAAGSGPQGQLRLVLGIMPI